MSMDSTVRRDDVWPALPLAEWKESRDTLHMYTQVVGKVRLALAPMEPQWAQVPLYLTSRGLTTSPIPLREDTFQIDFDFIDHELHIEVSDGGRFAMPLDGRPVADFYRDVIEALHSLDIEVDIWPTPTEIPTPIPFPEDTVHAAYDPTAVHRFWRLLVQIDTVFKAWHAQFRGRSSPVQFFWGTFDLAVARYSGRPAAPPPDSDPIRRRAMDSEEIASGFWTGDDNFPEPAFYSYTYPKPTGLESAPVRPAAAFWSDSMGEFLLRYEDVRNASSPREAILDFLDSTYEAGASLGNWDAR